MSIVVFWLDQTVHEHVYPCACEFKDDELQQALDLCKELRKDKNKRNIVISSELSNQVGKNGVDAVVDGKLPNGEPYDWKKRRI